METKNTWFMQKKFNSIILLFINIFAASFLLSCQTGPAQAPISPRIQGPEKSQENSQIKSTGSEVVQLPDFVGQRMPKVGVIFGPGGAKTFAHIGVLQELEKYKIPVDVAVGLEWGAVVGALYSTHGQSHEVDWKMSQLPKFGFSSKTLFSNKMRTASTKEFNAFLEKVFQDVKIENAKIPFACPFIRGGSGRIALATKGATKNTLRTCWYYPPIFSLNENMAAPFALAESVEFLKNKGAEFILLINVVESVDKKEFANWSEDQWSWFSWVPVLSSLDRKSVV